MIAISITVKQIKRRARKILFGNYSALVSATLFFTALSVGFFYLSNCFSGLLYDLASHETSTLVLFTLFLAASLLCAPLLLGYMSIITRVCSNDECTLSDLFLYYSSKEHLRLAYGCTLRVIPRYFIGLMLPFMAVFGLSNLNLPKIPVVNSPAEIIPLLSLICTAVFVAFAIIFISFLLTSYAIFGMMREVNYGKFEGKPSIVRFALLRLSMIPLIIFSVLTFGVMFPIYTLPFVFIAYTVFYLEGNKKKESVCDTDEEPSDGISLGGDIPESDLREDRTKTFTSLPERNTAEFFGINPEGEDNSANFNHQRDCGYFQESSTAQERSDESSTDFGDNQAL